ncbi:MULTISPECIES: Cof-type HAD-IIB family hydrolase [Rodentibacter]|uniref:Cof-type HAD-IIB family hydrolase n=1 Tax=Rodentibacter TaxID=1960084 RepID=UPI001CFC60F8|nr:Cof-type HAD-IIB family hydrolase [Rodentibacter sp. JRC1]GJI56736.1 putative phosphatase [Rodentibacter sp. JRC1]
MYKAVFSDFDGTLLTSDHKISPRTLRAIQRITQNGVPFVPISARSPLGILPYAKQIENYNVIVAFSGALILDRNLNALYSVNISTEDIQEINRVLTAYPEVGVNYYTNDDCVARDVNNKWVVFERGVTGIQIDPYDESAVYSPHKIQIIGEPNEIIEIENRLKTDFPHLSICRSHPSFLEVMHESATKGNAVCFLENYFNVKMEEVIAFGDNFNDLDMLQNVGLGVAMGNAPEEIKQVANRVTATNNEDGLALILEEIFPE